MFSKPQSLLWLFQELTFIFSITLELCAAEPYAVFSGHFFQEQNCYTTRVIVISVYVMENHTGFLSTVINCELFS